MFHIVTKIYDSLATHPAGDNERTAAVNEFGANEEHIAANDDQIHVDHTGHTSSEYQKECLSKYTS